MSNKRKEICLYCDHWQNGGVESYLMNQLEHWDVHTVRYTLLTAEKTTDIYDETLRQLGVKHVVLLTRQYTSPILRILHTFSCFSTYMHEHPADVLYLNLSNSVTMLYAGIAKHAGVPKRVVHSHCANIQKGSMRILKWIGNVCAKNVFAGFATNWWACSDKAAEFLFPSKILPKVQYIPNAIAVNEFAFNSARRKEMRERLRIANQLVIGTVGRCAIEKNQKFLLEAFLRFHDEQPNSRLLIVGDGPLRTDLEKEAERLGISQVCMFYGNTNDVPTMLDAMDVFCLPSFFEGYPVSAIEAQASGLPCFLSDKITQQAKLLPETNLLPIDQGTEPWAHALTCFTQKMDRLAAAQKVRMAGFDIEQAARAVERML